MHGALELRDDDLDRKIKRFRPVAHAFDYDPLLFGYGVFRNSQAKDSRFDVRLGNFIASPFGTREFFQFVDVVAEAVYRRTSILICSGVKIDRFNAGRCAIHKPGITVTLHLIGASKRRVGKIVCSAQPRGHRARAILPTRLLSHGAAPTLRVLIRPTGYSRLSAGSRRVKTSSRSRMPCRASLVRSGRSSVVKAALSTAAPSSSPSSEK